jgi:hypothetical protein
VSPAASASGIETAGLGSLEHSSGDFEHAIQNGLQQHAPAVFINACLAKK